MSRHNNQTTRRAVLALLAGSMAAGGRAQQAYPDKPVRLVVPFAVGSGTDFIGREVARILTQSMGQSFVVINRPGAQATIGAASVATAPPDGYTLLLGTNSTQSAVRSLVKRVPYDPIKDFAPITRVAATVYVVLVRADLPVNSLQELIAYGQANPGKLNWGHANAPSRVAGAAIVRAGKLSATSVPYNGVPQIITEMIGGQVDFVVTNPEPAAAALKSGRIRAIAHTAESELPLLPGLPPMSNVIRGFQLMGYYGLFAPAGTPRPIIDALNTALTRGMLEQEYIRRLAGTGGTIPFPAGPAELGRYVLSETERWAQLTKDAGVEPE